MRAFKFYFTLLYLLYLTVNIHSQTMLPLEMGTSRQDALEKLKIVNYHNGTPLNFNDKSSYVHVNFSLLDNPGTLILKFENDSLEYYYYEFLIYEVNKENYENYIKLFKKFKKKIEDTITSPAKYSKIDTIYRNHTSEIITAYQPAMCQWQIDNAKVRLSLIFSKESAIKGKNGLALTLCSIGKNDIDYLKY